jgi:hypothetical protein
MWHISENRSIQRIREILGPDKYMLVSPEYQRDTDREENQQHRGAIVKERSFEFQNGLVGSFYEQSAQLGKEKGKDHQSNVFNCPEPQRGVVFGIRYIPQRSIEGGAQCKIDHKAENQLKIESDGKYERGDAILPVENPSGPPPVNGQAQGSKPCQQCDGADIDMYIECYGINHNSRL